MGWVRSGGGFSGGGGVQGRCERRSGFVKIKKKIGGCQGRCERRSEVFIGVGQVGGVQRGGGGVGVSGGGVGIRVDVNVEVKFL